ncbi:hypothetical protein IE81DRAFT_69491 [Ceraceosorus guamensis]|uniref:HMG box domain-containing protein n=1 Tax=Ceraceosorus guamensis TaxID=1522189 RepID=A0A316VNG7_9BASI|nr:hypothetical protein IE81DRAFT_69491 [Ceraceosorus guamensis]PWN38860.1 hypothetical protein IE81DRAFT_69491 [Ceraceosorus guamensis]
MHLALLCTLPLVTTTLAANRQDGLWLRRGLFPVPEHSVGHLADQALSRESLAQHDWSGLSPSHGQLPLHDLSGAAHSLHDSTHRAAPLPHSPLHPPGDASSPRVGSRFDEDDFVNSLLRSPSRPNTPAHSSHDHGGNYVPASPSAPSPAGSAGPHHSANQHHLDDDFVNSLWAEPSDHQHSLGSVSPASSNNLHSPSPSTSNAGLSTATVHSGGSAEHSSENTSSAQPIENESPTFEEGKHANMQNWSEVPVPRRLLSAEAGSLRTRERRLREAEVAGAPPQEIARLKSLVSEAWYALPKKRRQKAPFEPEAYASKRLDHLIHQREKVAPEHAEQLEAAIAEKSAAAKLPEIPKDIEHFRVMKGYKARPVRPPRVPESLQQPKASEPELGDPKAPSASPHTITSRGAPPAKVRPYETSNGIDGKSMLSLLREKTKRKSERADTSEVEAKIAALARQRDLPVPTSKSMYYYRLERHVDGNEALHKDIEAGALSPRTAGLTRSSFDVLFRQKQRTSNPEDLARISNALDAKARSQGLPRTPPSESAWRMQLTRMARAKSRGKEVRPYRHSGINPLFKQRKIAFDAGQDTSHIDSRISTLAHEMGLTRSEPGSAPRVTIQKHRQLQALSNANSATNTKT